MPRKKSLADELAELINPAPAPEYDPEAYEFDAGARLHDVDDEALEAAHAAKPSKHAKENNARLRADIVIDDDEYRGRKTTRAAFFGGDEGVSDADSEDVGLPSGSGSEDDDDVTAAHRSKQALASQSAAARSHPAGSSGRGTPQKKLSAVKGIKGSKAKHVSSSDDGDEERVGAENVSEGMEEFDSDADSLEGEDEDSAGLKGSSSDEGESDDDDDDDDDDLIGRGDGDSNEGEGNDGEGDDSDDESPAEHIHIGLSSKRRKAADGSAERLANVVGLSHDDARELQELDAEYAAIAQEDGQALLGMRQRTEGEASKAHAVRAQQVLYERALEARIRLQRALVGGNVLPRPAAHRALVACEPELQQGFTALRNEAAATLSSLLDVQIALMSRNAAIDSSTLPQPSSAKANGQAEGDAGATSGPGPGSAAMWKRMSAVYGALTPFRDASLDRWHRRTVLSSGSGALRNNLRALNQSVSAQVGAIMRDPTKFIVRTQLLLAQRPRVLGDAAAADAQRAALHADAADADAVNGRSTVPASSVAFISEERDIETYDDGEFYAQLLKELIDKGMAGDGLAVVKKADKKRKIVDRRASKGRKEKLVNFMAPVENQLPLFAATLFSNLFGHGQK